MTEKAPRIITIPMWSDDNKGDVGITLGLMRLVKHAFPSANLQFQFISRFAGGESFQAHHQRFFLDYDIFPTVLPYPLARLNQFRLILPVLMSLWVLIFVPFYSHPWLKLFLRTKDICFLTALARSDVMLGKGGNDFYSRENPLGIVKLYVSMFPFLVAIRLGVPIVVWGQSVGPINGILQRKFLTWLINHCQAILVREPLSKEQVYSLDYKPPSNHPCEVTWDTGFLVETTPYTPSIANLPDEFVTMTLRPWSFRQLPKAERTIKYKQYIASMAALIKRINTEWNLPVVLLPQSIGPWSSENDYTAWDELKNYLQEAKVIEVRSDLTPAQLINIYSQAKILVGTRFHSVIFSLVAGTPAIAISYQRNKAYGMMSMFSLGEYTISIADVTAETLWNMLVDVDENKDEIKAKLAQQFATMLDSCAQQAKTLLAQYLVD